MQAACEHPPLLQENLSKGSRMADSGETVKRRGAPAGRQQQPSSANQKRGMFGLGKSTQAPAQQPGARRPPRSAEQHGLFSRAAKDPMSIPVTKRNAAGVKHGSGEWDADTARLFQAAKGQVAAFAPWNSIQAAFRLSAVQQLWWLVLRKGQLGLLVHVTQPLHWAL